MREPTDLCQEGCPVEAIHDDIGGKRKAIIVYCLYQGPPCPKSSCVPLGFFQSTTTFCGCPVALLFRFSGAH
jgi:hypothetical protein